jgi:TonB-linked SusC/RagA family outer membrane protein
MINFRHIVFLCVFFSVTLLHSQNTLEGTVTDQTNEPLFGVTVLIKGTTKGVTTNFDGFYQFSNKIDANAILVFSYLGMKTKEIAVEGKTKIDVVLEESSDQLEEVVVVGYGSQVKKDITGSVSTLKSETIESRANTQLGALIQGQAAGVQVLTSSGKPSAGFNIRIRGTNSIQSSSDPLYVVDGVPTRDTRAINPNDIDTITILKDGASTAIYGAQGANGVVLITTKRGKTSKPLITIDSYLGFSQVWNTLPVLNGEQYRDLATELGLSTDWDALTERTDWQNEIFQNGLSQNYQFSVSASNNGFNYYVSAGYTAQVGAVRSAELERANFKINLEQQVNDWLKIGTRIAYTDYRDVDINDNNNVNAGGVLLGALTTPSIIGIFDENGGFTSNPFQNWENPLASTDGLEREFNSKRFLGNIFLEAKFLKNFTYKFNYGIDQNGGIFNSFLDPTRTGFGRAIGGQSIYNTNDSEYYIIDNTISFKKDLENHKIDALVGMVIQKNAFENSSITTRNFASGAIPTPNGGSEILAATAFKEENANTAFISRFNYAFKDRYLFTANVRVDGSSIFGPNKRWGVFPSLSAGWRISNEKFFENVELINDLKLRVGYGVVGNDQFQNYAYLGRIGLGANYPIGGVAQPGTFPASIENLSLKWEESAQTNIGIDISLLDSRISFTAEAYIKEIKDLLLDAPLPTSTGFSSGIQNIGQLQNKGLEFSLQSKNITSENFEWNSSFNISFNRNEVIDLVGQQLFQGGIAGGRGEASLVREGEPLGILYGYIFGGVDPQTGNSFYIDRNGESTFTPTEEDRTVIGDANADFIYGFSNSFSFKGFDLSVLLEGSYGNDILNATRIELEGMSDPKNQSIAVLDRWRQPGDVTNIPRASFGNTDNSRVSTRFIEDASYVRFKAVTLGYEFPKLITDKLSIKSLRFYATGENLFTFTNYTGLDPEVNAFGGSNTVRGIDFGTYPQTRTILFGASIKF